MGGKMTLKMAVAYPEMFAAAFPICPAWAPEKEATLVDDGPFYNWSDVLEALKKYDIPLFRRKDGSFILHRILKVCNDGTYVVCGDNQTVLEYGVRDEQIIGVVEGIYRDKEFVSVSNFIYKIYSRSLWIRRLWRKSFIRRAVKGVLRRCRLIK